MSKITEPPKALYTSGELMRGYRSDATESIVETFTFQQFLAFTPLQKKGILPRTELQAISAHDATITEYLLQFLYDDKLGQARKVVGFMGGHSQGRSTQEYRDLANLARFLTQKGYLVVTGGGPGMMEAAHIGAYFSGAPDKEWDIVMATFKEAKAGSAQDVIPKITLIGTDKKSTVSPDDMARLHAWYKFAADLCPANPNFAVGESLAISTWEYGKEPVMPFATAYASYFQNSIRESQLVRESRAGIVYGKGGGGTLREIWQDVEENYYVEKREDLTPMIFFDRESIWGDLSSGGMKPLDIYSTILRVLNFRIGKKGFSWEDKIASTINHEKILYLLDKHVEVAQKNVATCFAATNA